MERLHRWLLVLLVPAVLALSGLAADRSPLPGTWMWIVLGYVAAALVLFRPKLNDPDAAPGHAPVVLSYVAGLVSLGLAVAFRNPWLTWAGALLCLHGAMRGALAARFFRDIPVALLLLFVSLPVAVPGWMQCDSFCTEQSTLLAARMLQWFDVRAWADGGLIHRYAQAFAVPPGAGGASMLLMSTVVVLAAGLFIRARWYELVGALGLAAALSLVYNAARIAWVVGFEAVVDPAAGYGAVLVLVALSTVTLLLGWRLARVRFITIRRGMEQGTVERPDRGTILNLFWSRLVQWWKPAVVLALLALAARWVHRADNPYRRAMLMTEVIDGLAVRDPAVAARACDAALKLAPGDQQLLLRRAHILTAAGDDATGAQVLASIDPAAWGIRGMVLHGLHEFMSGRAAAFAAELEGLPPDIRAEPGVAGLRLQLLLAAGNIPAAAAALPEAALSPHIRPHLHGLIPTLLLYQQRQAVIAFGRQGVPDDATEAAAQILAQMGAGDMRGATDLLVRERNRWPADPGLTACAALLAYTQETDTQEKVYEQDLRAGLPVYDADALWNAIEDSFLLCRPDLAWLAYNRLAEVDATDPGLRLAPALYGRSWFVFRKRRVGQVAPDSRETTVLSLSQCRRLGWDRVPLADELSGHVPAPQTRAYARQAVQVIESRLAAGARLSPRIWHGYVSACLLLDDRTAAQGVLVRVAKACPGHASFFRLWKLRLLLAAGDQTALLADVRAWTESGDWLLWQARAMQVNALMLLRQPDAASAALVRAQREIPGMAPLTTLQTLFDQATRGGGDASQPVPPAAEWTVAGGTAAEVEAQRQQVAGMPDSQRAWQQWVRASGGQTGVVAEAVRRFPADDELWLATLVVKVRSGADDPTCQEWLKRAAAEPAFSGLAWARAGDYLRRSGAPVAARLAAEEGVRRAPRLLAARNLAMRLSLEAGDLDRAAVHVRVGLEQVPSSRSLSELLACLYLAGARLDSAALEKVRSLDEGSPADVRWTIAAGRAALESGSGVEMMERLRNCFAQTRNATVGLLYAEVLYRNDKGAGAAAFLQALQKTRPDDVAVRNNLCHVLSCADETLPEAREQVPELIRTGGRMPVVLETAALVAYRSGDYSAAVSYLKQALEYASAPGARPPARIDLTPYESDLKKSTDVKDSLEAERRAVFQLVRQLSGLLNPETL